MKQKNVVRRIQKSDHLRPGIVTGSPFVWPPEVNLADHLLYRHLRERRGGNTALIYRGTRFTYEEIASRSARAASVLEANHVKRGDRVILLLSDSPAFVAAFFGALAMGAIAIPLNLTL